MENQLENALAELLGKVNNGIEGSTEFLVSELPEVVTQALNWFFAYNLLFFVIGLCALALWVRLEYVFYRWAKNDNDEDTLPLIYGIVGCVPRLVGLVILVTTLNLTWLKIWIAPKLFLIEYAASLIN